MYLVRVKTFAGTALEEKKITLAEASNYFLSAAKDLVSSVSLYEILSEEENRIICRLSRISPRQGFLFRMHINIF